MKKVISACIEQVVEFDSEEELQKYFDELNVKYEVISTERSNGKITIRIKKQYNKNKFI